MKRLPILSALSTAVIYVLLTLVMQIGRQEKRGAGYWVGEVFIALVVGVAVSLAERAWKKRRQARLDRAPPPSETTAKSESAIPN
jgi:hypothetical protein